MDAMTSSSSICRMLRSGRETVKVTIMIRANSIPHKRNDIPSHASPSFIPQRKASERRGPESNTYKASIMAIVAKSRAISRLVCLPIMEIATLRIAAANPAPNVYKTSPIKLGKWKVALMGRQALNPHQQYWRW